MPRTDEVLRQAVDAHEAHETLMREGRPYEALRLLFDVGQIGLAFRVASMTDPSLFTRREKVSVVRAIAEEGSTDCATRLAHRWRITRSLPEELRKLLRETR